MASVTTVIAPDKSICGKKVKLGVIDQIAPRDYTSVQLFFRLSPHCDKQHIFQSVRTGVHNAAKEFPQVLCCVGQGDNDREEMEVQWNPTGGAIVTFKDYTAPELRGQWTSGTFNELEREHFPLKKLPRRLVYCIVTETKAGLLPCLAVQSSFIDGGMILSFCMHHTVSDGPSTYSFVRTWAKHTRAASLGEELACPTSTNMMDRMTTVVPETDVRLEDLPDWRMVRRDDKYSDGTAYTKEELPEVRYATYFISEDNYHWLRQNVESANGKRFTGLETVSAFIWKSVLQARSIDLDKYPEAKLSITVDARGKMRDPEVSATYWGNFCEPNAVARMPTKDLCEPSPSQHDANHNVWRRTIPEAAGRIQRALAAVDNTAVRRLVGLLNQMPKSTSLTWNVDRWPGPDMLIVCANRNLYNSLDFGPEMGTSEAVRFTVGDTEGKPDGRCLLMPLRNRDGKGLEIMLQYDVETLDRLKQNSSFREFFDWRN